VDITKECDRSRILHGSSWILQKIHCRVLRIAHPITFLQRKGVKFQWKIECEKIFEQLKQFLNNAPILRIFYPNENFVVFTNVSKEGLGGVLSQNGFVICFESRKLKEHERLYDTHDLELESIVKSLKMWRK
jgi:hypothetical protein